MRNFVTQANAESGRRAAAAAAAGDQKFLSLSPFLQEKKAYNYLAATILSLLKIVACRKWSNKIIFNIHRNIIFCFFYYICLVFDESVLKWTST